MAESRLKKQGSPKGLKRWLFRAPILLYRWHLGALLGKRFVLLEHIGRSSGQVRSTVLEVVSIEENRVYVAAAWGEKSDWFLNVRKEPSVTFQLGSRRRKAQASEVDEARALEILTTYNTNHPKAFERLAKYILEDPGGTPADWVENVAFLVPVVELTPSQ